MYASLNGDQQLNVLPGKRTGFQNTRFDIVDKKKKKPCVKAIWGPEQQWGKKVLWGLTDYPSRGLYVKLLLQGQNDSRFPGEKAVSAGERGSRDRRRNEGQWKHPMGLIFSGWAAKLHFTSNFTKRPPGKMSLSFLFFSVFLFVAIIKSQLPYQPTVVQS